MDKPMTFKDDHHKKKYREILGKMATTDEYHCAVAYLLALDENICNNPKRVNDCFDFENDCIHRTAGDESWVTGYDRRLLKLAFNLWNDTNKADVSDVFSGVADLEYLLEAVRIRYSDVAVFLPPLYRD